MTDQMHDAAGPSGATTQAVDPPLAGFISVTARRPTPCLPEARVRHADDAPGSSMVRIAGIIAIGPGPGGGATLALGGGQSMDVAETVGEVTYRILEDEMDERDALGPDPDEDPDEDRDRDDLFASDLMSIPERPSLAKMTEAYALLIKTLGETMRVWEQPHNEGTVNWCMENLRSAWNDYSAVMRPVAPVDLDDDEGDTVTHPGQSGRA